MLAFDKDQNCVDAYNLAFCGTPAPRATCACISDHTLIPAMMRAHVLVIGIPCQPHSRAGKQLHLCDQRDLLAEIFRKMARQIEYVWGSTRA